MELAVLPGSLYKLCLSDCQTGVCMFPLLAVVVTSSDAAAISAPAVASALN